MNVWILEYSASEDVKSSRIVLRTFISSQKSHWSYFEKSGYDYKKYKLKSGKVFCVRTVLGPIFAPPTLAFHYAIRIKRNQW